MLTVRTGGDLDTSTSEMMGDLAQAIATHPLAAWLNGTVIVGTGGAGLITADDVLPRVVVPLPGTHAINALGIAQIERCDGVVVRDVIEAGRLAGAIGTVVVVVADDPHGATRTPFLVGTDAVQTTAAWDAVDENPDLRNSLSAVGRHRAGTPRDHESLIADAVIEAVLACTPETPAAFQAAPRD